MKSDEIRDKFLKFFEKRGHKIIPSSSLVPENDPSVLFTTAGMQQFKEYYTNPKDAEKDFGGLNVTTVQKCIRTGDIDEVGDDTHLTFFEMLGNFSFGGYGRKEAIIYAYDFITKEMRLDISYVTFFRGNENVPRDNESEKIWKEIGIKDIREEGSDVFWGPTGESGPCGPTTEIYCKSADGKDVEIWNIVFNEYFSDGSREKLDKGEANLKKLDILGIDTGMGFERLVSIVQKKDSVYDTDLFNNEKTKEERVIADHLKASLFIISDGVTPSNTGREYVVRRLLRRAETQAQKIKKTNSDLVRISFEFGEKYRDIYKNIFNSENNEIIRAELNKFNNTLIEGLKEIEKNPLNELTAKFFFDLYQTYGLPFELSLEEVNKRRQKNGLTPVPQDVSNHFQQLFKEHQKLSQTASVGMFKGGLLNHNEKTIKLHTAHHLLLASLQNVIGKEVKQKGSNITEERLRMDFVCDHKLTDEEKKRVEDFVNDKIKRGLNVTRKEMPIEEAKALGAEMEFGAKYPDTVSVYFILDEEGNPISKEFCGGPHVKNTNELASIFDPKGNPRGGFKILKEEAVSAGIRRIKAILL